ncbi:MAG TPA: aminoglycoside phosphotransferase [Opitutae bacterium]|nr:aminoglycoside phosphotransferase [Opitutae bacterium]|tara:strand:- start:1403 stop:2227 length:825 start_codon:yes stop_codon:yes gene_type:complete
MPKHTPIHIDTHLVQQLVATQFPQWAGLSIKPVEPNGWDNRTFHLGNTMTVRLPSAERYVNQVAKEHYWLPKLAPHLPLKISTPLAQGEPGEGYPWHWSIYSWIEGEPVSKKHAPTIPQLAQDLAAFLLALQNCDTAGAPKGGAENFHRGGDLAIYDTETREMIAAMDDPAEAKVATNIWEQALDSRWDRPPVWVHGDIAVGNLLIKEGKLAAVIDFGQLAIGDPACDFAIAWRFFNDNERNIFRNSLKVDAATWARSRGWALWKDLLDKSKPE